MVNSIIYLLAMSLIWQCGTGSKNELEMEYFIGSWASCYDDSTYVELHFTKDNYYAFHFDNDVLDYNVGRFKVCGDKLLVAIREQNIKCDARNINTININYISDDEFESIEESKKNVFFKLSSEPKMDFKLGTQLLESENYLDDFKNRKLRFKCVH
ncbi:hypothetical protein [Echinicola pacifica]|nr:hypothetical protein [Echinicola pacifica]